MRQRVGNPHNEAHGRDMRVYDWIAPAGTDPHAAVLAIEAAVPGLKLHHRGDLEVHGYVNTSQLPDGSLYVCVHVYDADCDDSACHAGHRMPDGRTIAHRKGPTLTGGHLGAIKSAVGEHGQHKLTGSQGDHAKLRALGFRDGDGPLRT